MTKQDPTSLPYRKCVGIMVINRSGLVWAGCRAEAQNDAEGRGQWWQMPQGGIDDGEDPSAASLRELHEETGIRTVELMAELPDWLTYDLPEHLIGKAWGGRYRGQSQRWFAYRFLGNDREIAIDPPPGLEREFARWDWVEAPALLDLIVPFKRGVYEQVIRAFAPLARPLAP